MRKVLNPGYTPVHGTAWGTAFGTASTLIAGVTLSLVTAGSYPLLLLSGAAIGAAAGNFVDREELKKFKKRLENKWNKLQETVNQCTELTRKKIISQEVIKKIQSCSSLLSESQHKLILNELETELSGSLQNVEDYEIYQNNQNLNAQLAILKSDLLRVQI